MKAAWYTCVLTLVAAASLLAERHYKSDAEYKLYSEATSAFGANDPAKALAALEAWKQQFPDSEYAPERAQLFVQAWARSNQPVKALEAARVALPGPFANAEDQLRLLYTAVTAVTQIPSPPPEVREVAELAAQKLLTFDERPASIKAEDWDKARDGLRATARLALVHVVLTPVREAVKAGDCAAAEASAVKAVERFPDSVQASWVLGSARLCLANANEAKLPEALYSLARAAALDPVRGMVDPAWQKTTAIPYFEKKFTNYHGADAEAMRALREQAMASPLPPAGFTLLSASQIEQKKQADLEARNPELALWLKIRAALATPSGPAYFASELKDAAVPPLAGTVVDGKPACRPRELRVAMTDGGAPEVLIVLSRPLTGKAQPSTIRFEGVPTAFSADPFLLTLSADSAKLSGLKTAPCTAGSR